MSIGNVVHTTRTVSTLSPILIIDCQISDEIKAQLNDCQPNLGENPVMVDSSDLSSVLDRHIAGLVLPEETLYVFPGNGGRDVESRLVMLNGHPRAWVFAKRRWEQGSDPVVIVDEIPTDTFMDLRTKVVFILDDVVGSGQTAYKLRSRNEWKFPKAIWYVGCWIDRGIRLKGFSHVFSSLTVRHAEAPEKKVPLNSLSTLVKDAKMCDTYARKNYKDYGRFLHVLEQIRKEE